MREIPPPAPMRQLDRPRPTVEVERRSDGTLLLSAGRDLPQDRPLIIDRLQDAAERRPNVTFLAQRRGSGRPWQRLTYAEAWARTGAIASWLIAQGYGPQSPPAAILSANSLEQALFLFGAQRAGLVVASLSPHHSLSGDPVRLDHALDLVQPSLVFAQESVAYGAALDRAALHGARIVTADGKRGLAFGALANASVDAAVAERRLHITADTPAKILFTSGSAGPPKAVLNTHGNLAAAIEMMRAVSEPLDESHVPVMLDWLPWHHTAGGNTSLNGIVRLAGTLYIDDGRPLPGRFQETIDNLAELSPSYFGSVPAAFPPLLEALERDEAFRTKFFKNLRSLGYGGALLPQECFDRLQAMAATQLGERLPFGSGWGMTETTGTGLIVYWNVDRAGLLGLPLPGLTAKLVPVEDRYELRVKGPNVMLGYYRSPEATQAAFDDEGFLRTGDAARWIDPARPAAGLAFAGRITEEFKLASGTWVRATTLRSELLNALQPHVRELVIAAPDRPWLGALVWLDPVVCAGAGWRESLLARLRAYNAQAGGSSTRLLRLLPLVEPPSAVAGEITDKDTIVARRVLERRASDVARLYAEPADPEAIVAG
ncbi:MAG: AMP-binding protein [Alphaproteobacteria bacterium]|nr:AMP-binding protein [Alphaproteobacteria bacterium]